MRDWRLTRKKMTGIAACWRCTWRSAHVARMRIHVADSRPCAAALAVTHMAGVWYVR